MKRRLVALLATLTLVLSTLVSTAPAAVAAPATGTAHVALGDSVAAGTGNPPYTDPACFRSNAAYPVLLSAQKGAPLSLAACSGATTQSVISTQLGTLGTATKVVTITVGINNLPWQQLLIACSDFGDAAQCRQLQGQLLLASIALPGQTSQMLAAVRAKAPHAQIIVTGYPKLFGNFPGTCAVGSFGGLDVTFSRAQATQANTGVTLVNGGLALGVLGHAIAKRDAKVRYLDVTSAFRGHGLCDTGTPWISGLVTTSFESSLHPNAAGQQAYATIVGRALR